MSDNPEAIAELGPSQPKAKRAYTRRAPIRTDAVRTEVRTDEVRPKKVRLSKESRGIGPYHVAPEIVAKLGADGIDLQWVAIEVNGAPVPSIRVGYERDAWEAVTPPMFGGILDGMFMPKGYKGEIIVQGQVLMWRPLELTLQARAEDSSAARAAVEAQMRQMKSGRIDGVNPAMLSPDHPHSFARLTREMVAPIPVPKS